MLQFRDEKQAAQCPKGKKVRCTYANASPRSGTQCYRAQNKYTWIVNRDTMQAFLQLFQYIRPMCSCHMTVSIYYGSISFKGASGWDVKCSLLFSMAKAVLLTLQTGLLKIPLLVRGSFIWCVCKLIFQGDIGGQGGNPVKCPGRDARQRQSQWGSDACLSSPPTNLCLRSFLSIPEPQSCQKGALSCRTRSQLPYMINDVEFKTEMIIRGQKNLSSFPSSPDAVDI